MPEKSRNGSPPASAPPYQYADAGELVATPLEEEEGGLDIRKYLTALVRYKWVIVLAALLGVGGAYVVWEQVEPEYVAHGSLWVQAGEGADEGPIVTDGLLQAQSWLDLLRSYTVLDTVAIEEELYIRTKRPLDLDLFQDFHRTDSMVPGTYVLERGEGGGITLRHQGEEAVVERGRPGDELGGEYGFQWIVPELDALPDRSIEFTLSTPRAAANRLRADLETNMDGGGSFIGLQLRARNRERAASVVNSVMDRYVDLAAELKSGQLDEEAEVLEQQLQRAEEELQEAERALEAFRVETITLPSEEGQAAIQPGLEMTRDPAFEDFFGARVDQEQVRSDRERLEEVAEDLPQEGYRFQSIEFIPSVQESSELTTALGTLMERRREHRDLLQQYSPSHPPVQEVADRVQELEMERIPALIDELVEQLRDDERRLEERIAASEADLGEIPPRAIEEARLRRRVDIGERLYTELRERYETAALARASSTPDLRILDRAQPPQVPTNDERARLALMVFAGFLGAGLGAAVLIDRLDPRLRTPDEISGAAGMEVLGTLPRVISKNGKKGLRNSQHLHEALRELRTNVEYAYGSAGPMIFTVSSTGQEEGKTLVASNLAVSFAELGRRVLVVDADTRRGDVHRYLGGDRKPGLTDYLSKPLSVIDVVRSTDYENLEFIPAGRYVADGPELLSSPPIGDLLGTLRQRYDVIIVDSPPFGAGSDPVVLSALTGNLLMVVRSGTTHREFMEDKLHALARVPVRVLGAVVNDFRPDRLNGRYRYYGSYLPGYESGSEDHGTAKVTSLPSKKG